MKINVSLTYKKTVPGYHIYALKIDGLAISPEVKVPVTDVAPVAEGSAVIDLGLFIEAPKEMPSRPWEKEIEMRG